MNHGAVVGIDPGVCGAIAIVIDGVVTVNDMPTVEVRGKRLVDGAALAGLLTSAERLMAPIEIVVLEHVQGVQGAGATSAFSFGRSFGLVEGVLAGMELRHTLVRPQRWTKDLGVSRDKGEHRRAAMRLWPAEASRKLFERAKDDGRADAALLCHWWLRHGYENPTKIGTKRT